MTMSDREKLRQTVVDLKDIVDRAFLKREIPDNMPEIILREATIIFLSEKKYGRRSEEERKDAE